MIPSIWEMPHDRAGLPYFAYGSNLSILRLQYRTPSAAHLDIGQLAGHQLRFHKSGTDQSAKCDAHPTGNPADRTWGRLFQIQMQELHMLDKAEGLGIGYRVEIVEVMTESLGFVQAFTYQAMQIDASLVPFDWYKQHVVNGAEECGLPNDYIAKIAGIPSRADPDQLRAQRELCIYQRK